MLWNKLYVHQDYSLVGYDTWIRTYQFLEAPAASNYRIFEKDKAYSSKPLVSIYLSITLCDIH